MKTKSKQIFWYHLYSHTVENALNVPQVEELALYLRDKRQELNISELYFSYYHDHFHILFSMSGRHSPSEMERRILGAVSWFVTAVNGEPYDFMKETVLHTVSPSRISELSDYLENHIDRHLNKETDKELERTLTQWQKLSS